MPRLGLIGCEKNIFSCETYFTVYLIYTLKSMKTSLWNAGCLYFFLKGLWRLGFITDSLVASLLPLKLCVRQRGGKVGSAFLLLEIVIDT